MVVEKQAAALLEQHNNFRAMKGLDRNKARPGGTREQRNASARRQGHLRKVKGWYFT